MADDWELGPKPEGPIWVDFSEQIMGLPMHKAVLLCNLALNQLSLSKIAEVIHFSGLKIKVDMQDIEDQT